MKIQYIVQKLNVQFEQIANQVLEKEMKFDYTTYRILWLIDQEDEGVGFSDISEFLGVTDSVTRRLVSELSDINFLVIAQDPEDARKNIALLSRKGSNRITKAQKILDKEFKKHLKALTSEEKKILEILLKKLG